MYIDSSDNLEIFKDRLSKLKNGNGSIISISGEQGFGKTFLLQAFANECKKRSWGIWCVNVESQSPIGKFNVGNIQPLLPFSRAIERLMADPSVSAKKKFAKNIGMTLLASIPGPDFLFYAVKEIGRDWRQYKKDKSDEVTEEALLIDDYFDTICSYSDKNPIVILMDDMHWSDAQSVELLQKFAKKIAAIPVIIAFTYQKSVLKSRGTPLYVFLEKFVNKSANVFHIEQQPFGIKQINSLCRASLSKYKPNEKFESWLLERSYGVPGVIVEYVKYFQKNPPFNEDGTLNDNFFQSEYLPTTLQSTFSQIIEKLSDEERNILAVCSAEGKQFTSLIVSDLLNTDVLSAIKKLRSLHNKTGIIQSMGARVRYGVKTTVYKFAQAFYHKFFEDSLEYEEHIALHGQIAALLKKKYEEAEDDAIREQIAPYLAAHSAESGDDETAKSMLLFSAKTAQKYGSAEIVKEAYENFLNVGTAQDFSDEETSDDEINPEEIAFQEMVRNAENTGYDSEIDKNDEDTAEGSITGDSPEINYTDFSTARKAIVMDYHRGNIEDSAQLAGSYFKGHKDELTVSQQAQLLSLTAKSYIELKHFDHAEECCRQALEILDSSEDPVPQCFVLNTFAVLRSAEGKFNEAYLYLQKIAKKTAELPAELRLLTMTNIALILEDYSPENARIYYKAARKLSESLQYDEFTADAFQEA